MQQKNRIEHAFSRDFKPRRGTKRNQHLNKYITKIFVTYKHSKTYKIGSGLIFRSVYEGSIVVTISFLNVWFLFICFTWLLFDIELFNSKIWLLNFRDFFGTSRFGTGTILMVPNFFGLNSWYRLCTMYWELVPFRYGTGSIPGFGSTCSFLNTTHPLNIACIYVYLLQ